MAPSGPPMHHKYLNDPLRAVRVVPTTPSSRNLKAASLQRNDSRALSVIVAVVLSLIVAMIPSAASAQGAETSGSVQSVTSCVSAADDVRVLFLIDESGSLKYTDPDDERITAARFALESFLDLSLEKQVETRTAGFSSDFRDETGEWIELSDESAGQIEDEIDSFADRRDGLDTDLPNALAGAYATLDPVAPTTCNLILLFADGGYDLVPRSSPERIADLGIEKPYAPGVEIVDADSVSEARVLGREALCDDEDGTMTQVDEAGIRIVTIALADSEFINTELLESLTVGRSTGGQCGSDFSGSRGAFTPVSNDDLALSFGAITGRVAGADVARSSIAVCAEGEECSSALDVRVDQLIDRFTVDAQFADPSQELVITHPNGIDRARLSFNRDEEVILEGAVAKAAWIDERSVKVSVIPTGNTELSPGDWSIAAQSPSSDSEPANLLVTRFPNLEANITPGEAFVKGEPGLVSAAVTTLEGRPITGLDIEATATVTDQRGAIYEVPLTSSGADDGTFSGTIDIPSDFVGPAEVGLEVVASTTDGLEFTDSASATVLLENERSAIPETESTSLGSQLGRLGILGLIFLAALLVWAFLWRRNESSEARFELEGISVASIPVVIRGDGALFRVDGQTRPLAMAPSDFHGHADPTPSRVLKLPNAELRVNAARHPFDERSADATALKPITGKYGSSELYSTNIDSELGGSWLFLLDTENSFEANADSANQAYGSVAGDLLVFLSKEKTDVPRFFQELPDQLVTAARVLFRDARAANASKVESTTADMLEWVDQWAGPTADSPQ